MTNYSSARQSGKSSTIAETITKKDILTFPNYDGSHINDIYLAEAVKLQVFCHKHKKARRIYIEKFPTAIGTTFIVTAKYWLTKVSADITDYEAW